MNKLINKKNLIILISALILTILVFAPTKFTPVCPRGKISDPAAGGSCGLFIDANKDQFCDYLYLTAIPATNTFEFDYLKEMVIFTLVLIVSIILISTRSKRISILRFGFLGISLIYFGFLLARKICPIATLQTLFILKEAIVLKLPIFLIFLLPILVSIVFGRVFCGWLCPIGSFQEIFFKIFKKMGVQTIKIGPKWKEFLKIVPFLILTVIIAAALTSGQMLFCRFEPFGFLFGRTEDLIPLVLLIGLLFLLPFLFRPFCQYICPYGALLSLLAKFSIFKLNVNKIKCLKCNRCQKACPMEAIKNQKINSQDCLLCKGCQRICPKGLISYSSQ